MTGLAHTGLSQESVLVTQWSVRLEIIALLFAATLLYCWGLRPPGRRRVRIGPIGGASFFLGLAVVSVALMSPLDSLGPTIFSAHMIQHLLLMVVAAPLVVLGRPLLTITSGPPASIRRAASRLERTGAARLLRKGMDNVVLVGILQVLVLWAWHLPDLYQSALDDEGVHAFEHATFFFAALLFWRLVLSRKLRPMYPVRVLLVFLTGLQSAALGALITLAGRRLYESQSLGSEIWSLTPLEDQVLAGIIMWVIPGILYFVVMIALLLRWFRQMDASTSTARGARGAARLEGG